MKKKKVLKPSEILKHIENKPIFVDVPEWNVAVECMVPTPDVLFKMKMENPSNEDFMKALFRASLVGFADEQLDELEKANGLKYFQLFTAVTTSTDLFSTAVGDENIKKS